MTSTIHPVPQKGQSLFVKICVGIGYISIAWLILFAGRSSAYDLVILLAVAVSVYIGVPYFLITIVIFIVGSYRHNPSLITGAKSHIILSLLIMTLIIPAILSESVLLSDIERAKSFCEHIVPELDKIKQSTGSYPENLASFLPKKDIPALVQYHSDKTSFSFRVTDGAFFEGEYVFTDTERHWKHFDF